MYILKYATIAILWFCTGISKKRQILYKRLDYNIENEWNSEVTDESASTIIAQLLFLESESPDKDMERDFFMYAEEAKNYGLIDEILIR